MKIFLGDLAYFLRVGWVGIEPTTYELKARYSTN